MTPELERACKACKRGLQATKHIYGELFREVLAEIETQLAGIRALEKDLTGDGT